MITLWSIHISQYFQPKSNILGTFWTSAFFKLSQTKHKQHLNMVLDVVLTEHEIRYFNKRINVEVWLTEAKHITTAYTFSPIKWYIIAEVALNIKIWKIFTWTVIIRKTSCEYWVSLGSDVYPISLIHFLFIHFLFTHLLSLLSLPPPYVYPSDIGIAKILRGKQSYCWPAQGMLLLYLSIHGGI